MKLREKHGDCKASQLLRLPGLRAPLRLILPPSANALLEQLDTGMPEAEDRIPYWAELWPSAEGLARHLLAGGGPRRPGRALELGCGLGLCGLVALRLGWDIRLGDLDPAACRWAARNLALNGFDAGRVERMDWRQPAPVTYDCILASDILYEKAFTDPLLRFLEEALAPAGLALIAEPGRPVADAALSRFAAAFRLRLRPGRWRHATGWRSLRILELRRRD